MKSKQICLAADERNELERFVKTGVHNTRLVNRAKVILALDTSGGSFRWQSMAADGSRNWKLETNGAVRAGHPMPWLEAHPERRGVYRGACRLACAAQRIAERGEVAVFGRRRAEGTQKAVPKYIMNF